MYTLQQATPDTFNLMLLGYGIIFGIGAAYIAWLALKWRALRRRLQALEAAAGDED